VRAYGPVGGTPPFIERGAGAHLLDVDGHGYIDYVGSWGALILGHADPGVLRAIGAAAGRGTSYGAPTVAEVELAEQVAGALPTVEMLRLVSSGTEATMSAIRLARGVTGRDRILKFEGCYHGHSDGLLVGAGSGVATLGIPGSPGVPEAVAALTVQVPFNDLAASEQAFARWGSELACAIVEPIAGNMGFVPPVDGFLEGLRELCSRHGSLLVFDEVMTGFRVAHGGAQLRLGVEPDLTTLGKVIGGGLPCAAYGGRREWMERIAPAGDVYQAGTLSGNPLAVAAGLETLRRLSEPAAWETLEARTGELVAGLREAAATAGVPFSASHAGGMFGFFFRAEPVRSFADARQADGPAFRVFFREMLDRGVYLGPSPYEAGFVSLAHGEADIAATLEAAHEALQRVAAAC